MTNNKHKCKNCDTNLNGHYCSNCGQKADEERFKLSNITELFIHGFYHVHGGLFFTIKELFIKPGEMLHDYIAGKRVAYVNPFTFLVLISIIGGFVFKWSLITEHINDISMATGDTIKFTSNHLNYRILLTIPIYALLCSLFYKRYKFNLAEHLIVNTFAITQSMLIMSFWMLMIGIVEPSNVVFEYFYYTSFISVIIYQIAVFVQFFNKDKALNRWFKAITVALVGLVLSFVIMHYVVLFIKSI